MQRRQEGHLRPLAQRMAEGDGAEGGQLQHQPIRQGLQAFVLVRLGGGRCGDGHRPALTADRPLRRSWPPPLSPTVGSGSLAARASSSDRTKPRSTRSSPERPMLTKAPARATSARIEQDRALGQRLERALDLRQSQVLRVGELLRLG